MSNFHNILFVNHRLGREDEGLKEALQQASHKPSLINYSLLALKPQDFISPIKAY
ncbi:hypothetical protein [Legionella israelensis]|uniref:hypothetical protein n=1 Tax=Legionella israelensis TaxID=454 RepID=UPI00163DC82A|nr:hypothetical protein [Legionella israelensis]